MHQTVRLRWIILNLTSLRTVSLTFPGMAWTLHKEMPDIQRLKSAAKGYGDGIGGTAG